MKNILNNIEVSRTEPLYGAVTGYTEHYGYFVVAQKTGEGLYSITYDNNTIVMDSGWYAPPLNGSGGLEKIELLEEMDFYGYRVQDINLFHGWACSSSTHPDSACYVKQSHNGDGTRSMIYFPGPSTGSANGIKTFGGSTWMYYYDFKEYGGNRGYVSEPVPGVAYNKSGVYYNNPVGIYPYTINLKYIEISNTVTVDEPIKAELPGGDNSTFDEHLFSDSTPVTSFTATYEYLCKEMFYGIGDISDENLGNDSYFVVFDSNGKKMYGSSEVYYISEGGIENLYNVPMGVKDIVVVFVKSTYSSGEAA